MSGNHPSDSPLKRERLARRLTLEQLGRLAGASEAAISLYETGKRTPDKTMRDRLARELGVTPEYLWPALYGVADGEAVA